MIGDTDAVPFEAFMADALYGPNGFYTSVGRAGRSGDFMPRMSFTESPQKSPELMARSVAAWSPSRLSGERFEMSPR